jgi:hypothetical protein
MFELMNALRLACAVLCFTVLIACRQAIPQESAPVDRTPQIEALFQAQDWQAIAQLQRSDLTRAPAEHALYLGIALARLERWEDARRALEAGRVRFASDPRFLVELAGVAFRQERLSEAKALLSRALRLAPEDTHASYFIGVLYFMEGNLDAALKYWNRIGAPRIEAIAMTPQPRMNPELLDRAFAISPASVLRLADLDLTRAQLDLLQVFSRYKFRLEPRADDKFDLVFQSLERHLSRAGTLPWAVSLLREIPWQSVRLDFFDVGGAAVNFQSMARWDSDKQRYSASVAKPVLNKPKHRVKFWLDGRREQWALDRAFGAAAPEFHMETLEGGIALESVLDGKTTWSTGAIARNRAFNLSGARDARREDGALLRYDVGLRRRLLMLPESRMTLRSSAGLQLGKVFSSSRTRYGRVVGQLQWEWFARPVGDDWRVSETLQGSAGAGAAPFDELYRFGLERDNDLLMRGHSGTSDGRKGAGPLGRDYLLSNFELDKTVYQGALWSLRAGPFLDTGRMWDPDGRFGSSRWLWDLGLQVKLGLPGVAVAFSFGKDLRSGRTVLHARTARQ